MPQSSAPPEPAFVATYWTLAGNVVPLGAPELEASPHDFIERVETAAALGYRGLGLIHSDLQRAVSRHGAATMRALLETHELELEVEFLVGWLEDGAAAAGAEQVFSDLLNAADQIGARRIKVGPDMQARAWPLEHMCERFARLCERASAVGAGVVIEPMPWSNITELDTARALIEGAGAPNGGLLRAQARPTAACSSISGIWLEGASLMRPSRHCRRGSFIMLSLMMRTPRFAVACWRTRLTIGVSAAPAHSMSRPSFKHWIVRVIAAPTGLRSSQSVSDNGRSRTSHAMPSAARGTNLSWLGARFRKTDRCSQSGTASRPAQWASFAAQRLQ